MKNVSIIIPIHNERQVLVEQTRTLMQNLRKSIHAGKYEVILVENGSIDNTYKLALDLANKYQQIRVISLEKASYGQAFKAGLKAAKYNIVVQFDIDFWNADFIAHGLKLISKYDIVIGSKNMEGSDDRRSGLRKMLSKFIEIAIQSNFSVGFTDTHGLKMLRRSKLMGVIDYVKCPNHFFDTELLIRAYHRGATYIEFPVDLREIRPTRFSFFKRSIAVIREFTKLMLLRWTEPILYPSTRPISWGVIKWAAGLLLLGIH